MADYHIYIHGNGQGNGNLQQKFKPTSSKTEESSGIASKFQSAMSKGQTAYQYASGEKSISSVGIGALSKAFPLVAIIAAVVKVGTSLVDKGFEHYANFTGDTAGQYHWNNIKAMTSAILNPIGVGVKAALNYADYRNQVINTEQQRVLSGNSYTGTTAGGKYL